MPSCQTSQHIHAMAAMAAGMGEPSCETIVDGVRITVHVPFEGPLTRPLAQKWIKRGEFAVAHGFLDVLVNGSSHWGHMRALVLGWTGSHLTTLHHSLN